MRTLIHLTAVFTVVVAGAAPAIAQTSSPSPLTIEQIPTQLVVAPDFKVTDIDGELGQLAGVYGGKLIDDALFIGGAGYWLTNGSDEFRLTYGGVLIGWSSPGADRIRFGVRGLTGIGSATLPLEFIPRLPPDIAPIAARFPARRLPAPGGFDFLVRPLRLRVSDDFFVFEPQGTIGFALFNHVTVNAAAGYRAVAFTDALRDRLHGPTGSLGVEFDW